MPTFVALLRGINVGGKAMVPMAGLRALFEAEGFTDVNTLLQSGNVVFTGKSASATALEKKLEKVAEKKFGRAIDFFVRDKAAWQEIVAGNPFTDEATRDPGHLVVLCLKGVPKAEAATALQAAITGREYYQVGKDCLYMFYPDGQGTSKLTNAVIERKLGMSCTARNWNTVQKIAALLQDQVPS